MSDKTNEFFKKLWHRILTALAALIGLKLASDAVQRSSAKKTADKIDVVIDENKETVHDIEIEKDDIKEIVKETETISEKVDELTKKIEKTEKSVDDIIQNNDSILEKYKRK